MTSEKFFEKDIKAKYLNFLNKYSQERKSQSQKISMASVMKDIASFTQDLAIDLVMKIGQCDHKHCFD